MDKDELIEICDKYLDDAQNRCIEHNHPDNQKKVEFFQKVKSLINEERLYNNAAPHSSTVRNIGENTD